MKTNMHLFTAESFPVRTLTKTVNKVHADFILTFTTNSISIKNMAEADVHLCSSGAGTGDSIKSTPWPLFYVTFYLAETNEHQLDYNIICLVFITSTKDNVH